MSIEIESTSDAPEVVQAVMGKAMPEVKEVEEKKAASPNESLNGKSPAPKAEADDSDSSSEDDNKSNDEKSEAQTEEGEEEEKPSEEEVHEKHSKGNRVQKRINKLTSKLSAKDQEIEQLRQQLASRAENVREEEKPEPVDFSKKDDGRPKRPSEFNYETEAEYRLAEDKYLEELTDWKYEQRSKAEAEKSKQQEFQKSFEEKQTRHNERIKELKKTHTDFDEVVEDAKDWARPTVALETLVLDSDYSAELAYELLSDEELFQSINSLSPLQMGVAIGRLEASLSGNSPSKEPTKFKTTKAPPPVNPVGGKSARSIAKSIDEPNLDFDEYKRRRLKQQITKSY